MCNNALPLLLLIDPFLRTVFTSSPTKISIAILIHSPFFSTPSYDNKAALYDVFRTPSPGLTTLRPNLTFPAGSAICDLGCGSGVFIPTLLESKPSSCEANDPSEGMVKKTEERYEPHCILAFVNTQLTSLSPAAGCPSSIPRDAP